MKHSIPFITAIVFIFLSSIGSAAEKAAKPAKPSPLTFSLSSNLAPAPAQVTARIRVEPDPTSRSLTVEWWSQDGAGGSHAVTLDGDRAATRQDFAIKRIEPGNYVVRVVVVRNDGSTLIKESNLMVVGEGSRFRDNGVGADLGLMPPARGGR